MKTRTHQANIGTFHARAISSPGVAPSGERGSGASREPKPRASAVKRWQHQSESVESACARRQQRQTRSSPGVPSSPDDPTSGIQARWRCRLAEASFPTHRANGVSLLGSQRHLPPPENRAGQPTVPDCHVDPEGPTWPRPFRDPRRPAMTDGTTSRITVGHSGEPVGYQPLSGCPTAPLTASTYRSFAEQI